MKMEIGKAIYSWKRCENISFRLVEQVLTTRISRNLPF